MSFLAPSQSAPPKKGQVQFSSQQEGLAVVWFGGMARLPVHWISPAYNRRTLHPGNDDPDWWYCDIIGVIAGCDTDYAAWGWDDDYGVNRGITQFRGGSPYVDITHWPVHPHETAAKVRIHWGDPADTKANALIPDSICRTDAGVLQDHPVYRGTWIELRGWNMGHSNPDRVRNLEVVMGRKPKLPQVFLDAGIDDTLHTSFGCNPVAMLIDLLCDEEHGAGYPVDRFDVVRCADIAAELADNIYRRNVVLDRQQDLGKTVDVLLATFNGFPLRRPLISFGRVPEGGAEPTPGSIPVWTLHEMTRPSAIRQEAAEEVPSEIILEHLNHENYEWSRSTVKASVAHRAMERSSVVVRKLTDKTISDRAVAEYALQNYIKAIAEPRIKDGAVYVREEYSYWDGAAWGGEPIMPGDLVQVSTTVVLEDESTQQLSLVYRVIERAAGGPGEVQFRVESELGQFPAIDSITIAPVPEYNPPDVIAFSHLRAWEMPWRLHRQPERQVAVLAERADQRTNGLRMYYSKTGASYGEGPIHSVQAPVFGLRGTLVASIDADDASLVVDLSGGKADIGMVVSQTESAQENDEWLVVCEDEVMSQGLVAAVGGDVFELSVLRGRQGSLAAGHDLGAEVWLIKRSHVLALAVGHAEFEAGSTRYLKVEPRNYYGWAGVGDGATVVVTVTFHAPGWLAPDIAFTSPIDDDPEDTIADDPVTFGAELEVRGEVFSGIAALQQVVVSVSYHPNSYGSAEEEVTLVNQQVSDPSATFAFKIPYKFNREGWYGFNCWGVDERGWGALQGVNQETLWVQVLPLQPTGLAIDIGTPGKVSVTYDTPPDGWDYTAVQLIRYEDAQAGNEQYNDYKWDTEDLGFLKFAGVPPGSYYIYAWWVKQDGAQTAVAAYLGNPVTVAEIPPPSSVSLLPVVFGAQWELTLAWVSDYSTRWSLYQKETLKKVAPFVMEADAETSELQISVPRAGTWYVTGRAVDSSGLESVFVAEVSAVVSQGEIDEAGEPPSYSSITGTKPPEDADNTLAGLETRPKLTAGGIELSSTSGDGIGFSSYNLRSYDPADMFSGGGFFLGRADGYYGFLVGYSTDKYLQYDGATGDVTIKGGKIEASEIIGGTINIGTGDSEFAVTDSFVHYGGDGGVMIDPVGGFVVGYNTTRRIQLITKSAILGTWLSLIDDTDEVGLGPSRLELKLAGLEEVKLSPTSLRLNRKQVVGLQQSAIANATGDLAATQATVNSILAALRSHGLIDS